MDEEKIYTKEYIKTLTPKIEIIKKNKFFDNQIFIFYDFGFIVKLGKYRIDIPQIYPWDRFESFKINFLENKNEIGLKVKEKYIGRGYTFVSILPWLSIYVTDSQKYLLIDLLKEKLIENTSIIPKSQIYYNYKIKHLGLLIVIITFTIIIITLLSAYYI